MSQKLLLKPFCLGAATYVSALCIMNQVSVVVKVE